MGILSHISYEASCSFKFYIRKKLDRLGIDLDLVGFWVKKAEINFAKLRRLLLAFFQAFKVITQVDEE